MKPISRRIFAAIIGVAATIGATTVGVAFAQTPDSAGASPLLPSPIPEGFGVNIHFVQPQPGEMQMIASAGFRWIRMDMSWSDTEKQRGVFDFSEYDRLIDAISSQHMKPLLILGFGNPLYNNGEPPVGVGGRTAWAHWVGAVVHHFRGRGILWEIMNEPNGAWFKARLSANDYVLAAIAAGQAMRAAAPGELQCGPALSTIDLPFLETCFKGGVLHYWDAVTVHPYRGTAPETVLPDYEKMRKLIDQYSPPGRHIPIVAGEWGYYSRTVDEKTQEKFLPRELLTNVAAGIPLSIWYDWHDDGPDPNNTEDNFGIVHYPMRAGAKRVYAPKPSYSAMETLVKNLAGYTFDHRIDNGSSTAFVLQFRNGDRTKIAAWTSDQAQVCYIGSMKHTLTGDVQYFDGPR